MLLCQKKSVVKKCSYVIMSKKECSKKDVLMLLCQKKVVSLQADCNSIRFYVENVILLICLFGQIVTAFDSMSKQLFC